MAISRRQWLNVTWLSLFCGRRLQEGRAEETGTDRRRLALHQWVRDPRNPIFVPHSSFDKGGSQGPCVVLHEGRWWLFYAGIGTDGVQRICLATARPEQPTDWTCLGPVLDLGGEGTFDGLGCTYPYVHRIGRQWHLYYSGRSNRNGPQHFSNYWGIGLAQSDDLQTWKKYSTKPVLEGDGIQQYPDNRALVGLGNIVNVRLADGRPGYRLYYTLLPGLHSQDWDEIEHKICVAAHSADGVNWFDREIVLERRGEVTTENIGVVGLQVWKTASGYRGAYTGLGTKYDTYALVEATSADGLRWERGGAEENVSLALRQGSWESGMIGYPHILADEKSVRIFYNGTGGGQTGIGMAVAEKLH